jgi:hypothetical protein
MSTRIFSRYIPGWVARGKYDPLPTVTAVLPTVEEIEAELVEVPDSAPQAPRKKR